MKAALKVFLQPLSNRHYTSRKRSVVLHLSRYLASLTICVLGALTVDAFFWFVFGAVLLAALVDYVVFDTLWDKLTWVFFWRRFYENERSATTEEHRLIKALENKPSPENRQKLADHLKRGH